jgi:hypothetical protein
MPRASLILRWLAALLIAAIVYLVVFLLGVALWRHFGGDVVTALSLQVMAATSAAVLGGTFVLPRQQRRDGAFVIWMLVLCPFLYDLVRHFSAPNLNLFGAALMGGWAVYAPIVSLARSTKQPSHYEQESLMGRLPRPIRRLGLLLSLLFVCIGILVTATNLYLALRYHLVLGGSHDRVSYGEHPVEFWWSVFANLAGLLIVFLIVIFGAWLYRSDRQRWRKREIRPPLENVVRQSLSER